MTKSPIPPSPNRKDYTEDETYQAQARANEGDIFALNDPFELFGDWMADARAQEINDSNSMSLATVDADGNPDVRIVLLKSFDEAGFVFYSNANSAKGQQLAVCGRAALCLHWKSLRRQVRIRGGVEEVTEAESDAYFASRARGARLGAWASQQSDELASREQFEKELKRIENKYEGRDVPRPQHWMGWRVIPDRIEFWRDRPFRLHDRLAFSRNDKNHRWTKHRLYP